MEITSLSRYYRLTGIRSRVRLCARPAPSAAPGFCSHYAFHHVHSGVILGFGVRSSDFRVKAWEPPWPAEFGCPGEWAGPGFGGNPG